MAYRPQRYSQVPWIAESDLNGGRALTWEYDQGDEKIACWPVSCYEGKSSQSYYLIIHATKGNGNDGGIISLACSQVPHFDWYAQFSMGVSVGSKRHPYRGNADFWKEAGA